MDDTQAIAAVAGAVTAIFFGWQLLLIARDSRRTKALLYRDLLETWSGLGPKFRIAIMLAEGPDSYYTPVDPATRSQYRALQARRASFDSVWSAVVGSTEPPVDAQTEVEAWARSDLGLGLGESMPTEQFGEWLLAQHDVLREVEYQYELAAREVITFLANLTTLTVEGRVTQEIAYELVGTDVVRRGGALRTLICVSSNERAFLDTMDVSALKPGELENIDWSKGALAAWSAYLPGVERRVLALLDLLWARAARVGDLTLHELHAVAAHKAQSRSGLRCRARIKSLARRSGHRARGLTLSWQLLWSEFPNDTRLPTEVRGSGFGGVLRRIVAYLEANHYGWT